jgi:hypothetical protein
MQVMDGMSETWWFVRDVTNVSIIITNAIIVMMFS